jgi:hypothetical protein
MNTLLSRAILLGLALMSLSRASTYAACSELVTSAFDRGWYDAEGNHYPHVNAFLVGESSTFPSPLHNWFAFSLPVLTQNVVAASLRFHTGSIGSPGTVEKFQLWDVSTPVPVLTAGGNSLAIYQDLASGVDFGSRTFVPSDANLFGTVNLSPAAVDAINAASGDYFALGGSITTLDSPQQEFLFGGTSGSSPWLVLEFASESPLGFSTHPQSQDVPIQTPKVTLFVDACGSSTLHFQWQFNGTNLPGARERILTLYDVTPAHAGEYRVVLTNLSGAVTSDVAILNVISEPPTANIFVQSGSSPAYTGRSIALCGNVTGVPGPALQWRHNGTNIPGATESCLYLNDLLLGHAGDYTLVASNLAGSAVSDAFTLVVNPAPPVYAYYPLQQSPFPVGFFAYLCASTDISPFPSFQWQLNGVDIPGATNQCHYINIVRTNDAGVYTVVATNTSVSHTSPPIVLDTYFLAPQPPNLYFVQGSPDALVGNDVTLCASVYASPPFYYQWRRNGVDLPGENDSCLSLFGITTNQAGTYDVVVTNVAGSASSGFANISVRSSAPIFVTEPSSQAVVEGTTVRFRAHALAGPPAEHTLLLNGTNVALPFSFDEFQTGGFTLLDVTPADAGDYYVIASNSLGMATSQVAVLTVTPAGPLDRWPQRNPLPQSQELLSLAYGNGLFAAVGQRGTVVTSPDGTNWTVQPRRVDLSLRGITYGAGLFIAVGDGGTVLSSVDGTNWVNRYTAPLSLNGVAYGNGMFVAVGESVNQTYLVWSTNIVDWHRVLISGVRAERAIAFGNGTFVAVGSNGAITTTNAVDWSVVLFGLDDELEGITFAQDQFIVAGDVGTILVSSNATLWALRDTDTARRLQSVTYGNGLYITVGGRGVVFTSPDTITWTPRVSGTPDRLESILHANGLYVAVGENGTTITSTNGINWGKQNRGVTRDLDDMIVVGGLIVIAGKGGTILTSTNGTDYTAQNASVTNDLHGIAWGNGLFVAVGEPGIIITSSNAIHWTKRESGNTNSLKNAAFGGGLWVAVGTEGAVITSPDGLTWSAAVTSPPYDLNDVAYGNGRFVIAGDGQYSINGSCFVSSNAVSWTLINYPFSKNLRSITFTNGIFFVTANDSQLFTSENGVSWLPYLTPPFANLRAATFAQGFWTVVGNRGYIATSSNLLQWTIRPTRTFENLHGVVYLDGKLVTIGNRGTILQTERFVTELEPVKYQPAIGATVAVRGMIGNAYNLEASTNFVQWDLLRRFTNLTERTVYLDTNATAHPYRFYRISP